MSIIVKIRVTRAMVMKDTIADTIVHIEDEVVIRATAAIQIVAVTKCVVDRTDYHRVDFFFFSIITRIQLRLWRDPGTPQGAPQRTEWPD